VILPSITLTFRRLHNHRSHEAANAATYYCYCCCCCNYYYYYYATTILLLHPLNGLFSRTIWLILYQKGKIVWIWKRQEVMGIGMQWYQPDHTQIICTSIQTENDTMQQFITHYFYRPDAVPDAQPAVWKHWRHNGMQLLNDTENQISHKYSKYHLESFCANVD